MIGALSLLSHCLAPAPALSVVIPAVIFGSPWLLLGLLFAAIPILIHLLHKRQFQETSWAAMRFLMAATRRHSRRLQLQQLVLLAVRTLAVALLIFALARPLFESAVIQASSTEPTHRVILIDASTSMRRTENGESLFARAVLIADSIINSSSPGDAIQLVRICDQSNRMLVSQPAWEQQIVADELKRLEPTWESGSVASSLEDVARLLETADELKQKQVSIISDFQLSNWAPVGSAGTNITESLQSLGEAASLQVFNVGLPKRSNVAVTSCRVIGAPVMSGQATMVQATLRRWGEASTVQAELLVNDRERVSETVDFAASDTAEVTFEHVFNDAGQYSIRIRVAPDEFPADDQRWATVEVLDTISTLLVNGRQSGKPMGNATDFVKLSLIPDESPEPAGPIRVRVITDGELMSVDPSRYRCVFLCNVGLFTDQEADFLARYATLGGGVVFLTGDQVRADVWNRVLYREGKGILPAELLGRVGSATTPSDVFLFNTTDVDHPLVSDYRGNPGFGLENVLTFEYFKSRLSGSQSVRTALSYENGDPCVVESQMGNGHVLLVTTAGDDRRWSTWNTIGGTYATLINEIVRFVASGTNDDCLVGQPVRIPVVELGDGNRVVVNPTGIETPVQRGPDASVGEIAALQSEFTYRDTSLPGVYQVQSGLPTDDGRFAVNVDPIESSPDIMNEAAIRDDLMGGAEFFYETDFRQQAARAGSQAHSSGPLVRWLLWCVAILLLVEQVMAWRFQWGLFLLLMVVGATFVVRASTYGAWLGIASCVVLGSGVFVVLVRMRRAA